VEHSKKSFHRGVRNEQLTYENFVGAQTAVQSSKVGYTPTQAKTKLERATGRKFDGYFILISTSHDPIGIAAHP